MEFTLKYRSRIVINAIFSFLSENKKVLDIGCGNGVVSYEIKKFFSCNLIGTDIFNYFKKDIDFKQMRKEDELDFSNKEFDIGLFIDVLHHTPFKAQVKLIREALRVCSEVLIFEVKPTFIAKAVDYLINKTHNSNMPILLTHRTKEEWIKLFSNNNIYFKFYKVKKPIFYYPSTNYLFYLKQQ